MYAQEFSIQQLERKVRRAQGERSDEEKDVLQLKIANLTSQLEVDTKRWNMLNQQMKKSLDDIRAAKRRLESLEKERLVIATQIDDLNLYTESAVRLRFLVLPQNAKRFTGRTTSEQSPRKGRAHGGRDYFAA